MRKFLLFLGLATAMGMMADEPLWLRNTAISPDGSKIAFTYKGQIYTVNSAGGDATRLTSGESYNTTPFWSPDGSQIAFSSDREGSADVFVISANGGRPRRLTTHSGNEVLLGFKDNDHVMYTASGMPDPRSVNSNFWPQVYEVDLNGGRPELLTSITMRNASADNQGRILYQDRRSLENEWRKHETSSGATDVWLLDNGKYTKLTNFKGNNRNPVWGGGDTYYYICEKDGTMNVYRGNVTGGEPVQLTEFKNHPVRHLSATADGSLLAFSWNGEIYSLAPGGRPKKVDVNIVTDDYEYVPATGFDKRGVTDYALSPDEKTIAFIVDGDVYLTSVEYGTTRRVTDTPAQERSVSWVKDGRSIVYDSDRDGLWQLFTSEIKNDDEKSMLYATELVEKPLYKSAKGKPAFFPVVSPDGKQVAFLEDRTELKVIDLKSKKVNTALDGKYNYSYSDGDVRYSWSPDSRWLLCDYIGVGGWNNSDIALVKADGSEVVDLTESGYSDGNATWALDGKAVIWQTGKYGYKSQGSWGNQSDAMIMFLDGDAYDRFNMTKEERELADKGKDDADKKDDAKKDDKKGAKKGGSDKDKKENAKKDESVKPLEFDLENRRYRKARLTPSSSRMGAYYLDKKGDKFYYVAAGPDGNSLYERNLKEGGVKILAKGLYAYDIIPDKKGENLYIYTRDGLQKLTLGRGKTTPIKFEAEVTRDPASRRSYMYEHMLRQVNDKFYDENLHGVDWQMYGDNYRRFLPHVNNNYDFAILLSEILGELNASHTGGSYRGPAARSRQATASLGAFYDPKYHGDGLRVVEVLKRGPLDLKSVGVKSGDIIMAVDGRKIEQGADYNDVLNAKAGRRVRLDVKKAGGKDTTVYVKPISGGEQSELMYQRWIERNEAVVDSVSGGRVGYVHIKGMDAGSYSEIYDRLLGKYRNCDAVVVDTRHNGGGWLHNDVALLLNGKEYVRYSPRGRYIGSDPFSQWTKPSVMLVDESNYSDAHGTPYVYQTLGIGEIVGAPVPGTMTAVWWERQIDPTITFGIPEVTSLDRNGKALENQQLQPDVEVYNTPEQVLSGVDNQLITATKRVMEKIK